MNTRETKESYLNKILQNLNNALQTLYKTHSYLNRHWSNLLISLSNSGISQQIITGDVH